METDWVYLLSIAEIDNPFNLPLKKVSIKIAEKNQISKIALKNPSSFSLKNHFFQQHLNTLEQSNNNNEEKISLQHL
jgi:hypothetical protein